MADEDPLWLDHLFNEADYNEFVADVQQDIINTLTYFSKNSRYDDEMFKECFASLMGYIANEIKEKAQLDFEEIDLETVFLEKAFEYCGHELQSPNSRDRQIFQLNGMKLFLEQRTPDYWNTPIGCVHIIIKMIDIQRPLPHDDFWRYGRTAPLFFDICLNIWKSAFLLKTDHEIREERMTENDQIEMRTVLAQLHQREDDDELPDIA